MQMGEWSYEYEEPQESKCGWSKGWVEKEGKVDGETNIGQFMEDLERTLGIFILSMILLYIYPPSF